MLSSDSLLVGQCSIRSSGGLSGLKSEDWPWWRGPQHDGIVRQSDLPPTKWNATEGIVWSVDVPGRGNGSPIVVGDRVILATCDEAAGSQSLLAFDRKSGKQLWNTVVHADGAMRKNSRSTGLRPRLPAMASGSTSPSPIMMPQSPQRCP